MSRVSFFESRTNNERPIPFAKIENTVKEKTRNQMQERSASRVWYPLGSEPSKAATVGGTGKEVEKKFTTWRL